MSELPLSCNFLHLAYRAKFGLSDFGPFCANANKLPFSPYCLDNCTPKTTWYHVVGSQTVLRSSDNTAVTFTRWTYSSLGPRRQWDLIIIGINFACEIQDACHLKLPVPQKGTDKKEIRINQLELVNVRLRIIWETKQRKLWSCIALIGT